MDIIYYIMHAGAERLFTRDAGHLLPELRSCTSLPYGRPSSVSSGQDVAGKISKISF